MAGTEDRRRSPSPPEGLDANRSVPFDRLLGLIEAALTRAGMTAENARAMASTIARCERDGARAHGLLRLPSLCDAVRGGWADGRARPAVVESRPAILVADARNGFAQAALAETRGRLAEMARATGMAALLVRNAHHFAALWPDIEPFAAEGFVALTCVTSRPRMAIWGGRQPVLGTNAMAFACPRHGGEPLVWDQSSSVMAQGELLVAAADGRAVPPGTGLDRVGAPTTSPEAILDGGALAPFGGPKGAAIAVMVEILAAALTGAAFGIEEPAPPTPQAPSKCGQFLLIIDPGSAAADAGDRAGVLCAAILEAGASRLPGERRREARRRAEAHGIPLSAATYASLLAAAGET